MSHALGIALAVAALGLGYASHGWRGVVLAVTVVVFWLLLQFSRAMRAMRQAGQAPVGHVDSAVMLNAKLQPGMTMLQVIGLTRSLGRKLDGGDDHWSWSDEGGSTVKLRFEGGKLARFELDRPAP